MQRIQYIRDDAKATNDEEKCQLCDFKYVVKTTCCQKPLCEFHTRDEGEHADQPYYSCESCQETEYIGETGFIVHVKNVYCEEHNNLVYCKPCESYYCNSHTEHECITWYTVPNPVFTEQEMVDFQKKILG